MIGDGKCDAVTVAGDRLRDMDKLVEIGTNVPLPSAVKNTKDSLSKKVFEYVSLVSCSVIYIFGFVV